MKYVVLGLGSNKSFEGQDSLTLLRKACICLKTIISDLRISSVYCTKPMYVEDQDDFYNMVLWGKIEKNLSPHELLEKIHVIESSLGRARSKEIRNGPRSIDIDIEFFDGENIKSADLMIPHPRIEERDFVVLPLLEILNKYADIQLNKDFSKIGQKFNSSQIRLFVSADDFWK